MPGGVTDSKPLMTMPDSETVQKLRQLQIKQPAPQQVTQS